MSENDNTSGFLTRVGRAVRSGTRRAGDARSGLIERVRGRVEETLAPAIEEAAKKMLLKLAEPQNAQKLQETLAGFAQFAMKSGFRSDPNAALLFEFVDQLEQRHSRQKVLELVVQHAVIYEQDLLAMLTEAVQNGRDISSMGTGSMGTGSMDTGSMDTGRFDAFRERASTRLLTLLCSLASLESEEPVPPVSNGSSNQDDSKGKQVAYFEQAPIDERFKPLARMAAGEKEAFDPTEHSRSDTTDADTDQKSPGLVRRTMSRLSADRLSADRPAADRPTALARLMPSLSDPATRFLTTSYLFFMQSYLVRAMIEGLPEMLAAVRDLEDEAPQDVDAGDVIEVGD